MENSRPVVGKMARHLVQARNTSAFFEQVAEGVIPKNEEIDRFRKDKAFEPLLCEAYTALSLNSIETCLSQFEKLWGRIEGVNIATLGCQGRRNSASATGGIHDMAVYTIREPVIEGNIPKPITGRTIEYIVEINMRPIPDEGLKSIHHRRLASMLVSEVSARRIGENHFLRRH